MTEAEAKLIDAVLEWSAAQGPYGPFNVAAETVRAERSRHPYGSIAESMMVKPRNPDRYRFPDHVDSHGVGHYVRDVCDPAPMQVSTSSISRTTLTDRYDVREPRYPVMTAEQEATELLRKGCLISEPQPPGDPPYRSQALRSLRTDGKVPNTEL